MPHPLSSCYITHGLSTFVILLSGWLTCCFIIDWLGRNVERIKATKIQPYEKSHDADLVNLARRTVIRNWIAVGVQTCLAAPLLEAAFPLSSPLNKSEDGVAGMLGGPVCFFVAWLVTNDFLFTIAHALYHEIPWLYKFAHKEHHTWKAPHVWMSHAMTFTEISVNGIAVMAWPLVHSLLLGRMTPLWMVWLVQLVSQLIGCIEHSGYDFFYPLVFFNPAWFNGRVFSTTKHHDDHHKHFQGNYGGYFACWDIILGTNIEDGQSTYKKKKA
ncbi:hypothetical protein TrLO_g9482 [Triparma laevis f. longispina]|uniref:Fatty acid hydroxylase domain-containing protein n=1 Tax=Triparma laevis f. longispina TaxID=1714387 RepID=A0A9W7EIZ8_9STRA|nr:hypothetical protein TrLO_g9482 [Triparma laevis f. longispina]